MRTFFLFCSFFISMILCPSSRADLLTPAPQPGSDQNKPVTLLGFIGQSPSPETLSGEDFLLEKPYQAGGHPVTELEITPYQNLEQNIELFGLYARITGSLTWGGKDGTLPVLNVGKVQVINDNFKHWIDFITRQKNDSPNKVILAYIPPESMGAFQNILAASEPDRVGEHTYRYTLKSGVKLKDALKWLYTQPSLEYIALDYTK